MIRSFVAIGSINAAFAVAAGAFGAHGLRERISQHSLEIYETAVRYQMFHALAMILCALLSTFGARTAGWLFLSGILLFSGSLYALALTETKWLGAITPIGGLAFLAGWAALAWSALRG